MSSPSKSKHWIRWNVSVSSTLSNSAAYGPPCTQRCRCWRERARQQVREREQPPLRRVEGVEVLDRLVQVAVVRACVQPVLAARLQEHAHEREQEVQVLRGRLEAERVDGEGAVRQAHPPDAAAEQRGQLLVAPAEVEDDRDGVVLLRVREDEVQQERLAAPGRAQDERVADIVVVQVPEVRRLVLGLEDREALAAAEMRAASARRCAA